MNSRHLKISTLFLASVLASVGASAHADQIQINTGGTICHYLNPAGAGDFDYNANAIVNTNANSRQIACPIPRPSSSLPLQVTVAVDGHNDPGAITSCTITVFDNQNTTFVSRPFSEVGDADGSSWHREESFSGLFLDPSYYISMTCTLPGNRTGTIRGVTAHSATTP